MNAGRNLILAGACFSALCQGVAYTISVFIPELMVLFGRTDTAPFAFIFSLHTAALPAGSILVGIIEKKLGAKGAYLTGGLCFTAAFICAAAGAGLRHLPAVQIGFGLMTGLGSGMVQGIYLKALSMWFQEKRGFASGVVMAALGSSNLIFAPLAEGLLRNMSVYGVFLVFGGIIGLLSGTAYAILRLPGNYREEAAAGKSADWKEMIKSPVWFGVITVYAAGCYGGLLLGAQTKIYGLEAAAAYGAEMAAALSLVSVLIFSIVNCGGRFVWASVSDKLGRMETMLLMLAISCAALIGLYFWSHSYAGFTVMLVLAGLCYGGFLGITPPVVADYFGAKHQTINLGITDFAFAAAGLAAPWIGAAAGLRAAAVLGAVLCVIGIGAGVYTGQKYLKLKKGY